MRKPKKTGARPLTLIPRPRPQPRPKLTLPRQGLGGWGALAGLLSMLGAGA
jgi:hypothetical protein